MLFSILPLNTSEHKCGHLWSWEWCSGADGVEGTGPSLWFCLHHSSFIRLGNKILSLGASSILGFLSHKAESGHHYYVPLNFILMNLNHHFVPLGSDAIIQHLSLSFVTCSWNQSLSPIQVINRSGVWKATHSSLQCIRNYSPCGRAQWVFARGQRISSSAASWDHPEG